MIEGWKVFTVENGSLTSVIQRLDESGVIYEKGEVTVPKQGCGPLLVFTSYEAARHFCDDTGYFLIKKVLYEPSDEVCIWNATDGVLLSELYEDNLSSLIPGTIALASAVLVPKEGSNDTNIVFDTNITFILLNGERYEVKELDRIGRQYVKSWLSERGRESYYVREWNIDVVDTFSHREKFDDLIFVVGKCGTAYGEIKEVKTFISADKIVRLEF
jgi:hypothetical protein